MKHWTWEKVKAEMDAAIADGPVYEFWLKDQCAALYMRQTGKGIEACRTRAGDWRQALPYRDVVVLVFPTCPGDVEVIRTK